MDNRGYLQKTIALRDGKNGADRTDWDALEAEGYTPIQIWRLGVASAKSTLEKSQKKVE